MKRLFLILLLALLPLQYAWAAAAAYCEHEAGKGTHFGHHSHQHKQQGQQADAEGGDHEHPGKPQKSTKVHADCAACQFGHQAWLDAKPIAALPALRTAWPPHDTILFTSHIADGRQRPDWSRAA